MLRVMNGITDDECKPKKNPEKYTVGDKDNVDFMAVMHQRTTSPARTIDDWSAARVRPVGCSASQGC